MTSTAVGWELYRSFLAVLIEGSLSGAARALNITQPTVGRHIAALETALSQPLFTRSPSGLLPTEAALELRPHAEAMNHAAMALERAATTPGEGIAGTVRISASEVMAVEVLPPILARLRHAHSGLKIELAATNRVQDLLQRETDIAVRMGQPGQDALIARHVGAIELGLYAHTAYLATHGTPSCLDQLTSHALIGFDTETPYLRTAREQLPAWQRKAFSLRADSDLAQLALLRAGCGIGVCQAHLARRDPALVRVLPAWSMQLQTWVSMHEDLRRSPRCQVAFKALASGLETLIVEP